MNDYLESEYVALADRILEREGRMKTASDQARWLRLARAIQTAVREFLEQEGE